MKGMRQRGPAGHRFFGRLPVAGALLAVAAVATWTGVSRAPFGLTLVKFSGTTHCTGTLPPGEYDRVQVDDNQTCTITPSDIIDGNVTVEEGATLNDLGGVIHHNLNVDDGGSLNADASSGYNSSRAVIGGTLDADGLASLQVRNTDVGDDINVSDLEGGPGGGGVKAVTAGADFICSSTAEDLTVTKDDKSPAAPIVIGDTQDVCGQGGGNTISHDLRAEKQHGSVDVSDNSVGHNLTVENNKPGGATVNRNTAGHNADCDKNSPFTGTGNTASGKDTCNA